MVGGWVDCGVGGGVCVCVCVGWGGVGWGGGGGGGGGGVKPIMALRHFGNIWPCKRCLTSSAKLAVFTNFHHLGIFEIFKDQGDACNARNLIFLVCSTWLLSARAASWIYAESRSGE